MDYIEMVYRVVESQGIVAGLLLIKMWQSSRLNSKLIAKNCELQRFIMECLSRELDEEHKVHSSSQSQPDASKSPDLVVERVFVSPNDNMSVD